MTRQSTAIATARAGIQFFCLATVLTLAPVSVIQAEVYSLTVAGLGGDPAYEHEFTSAARQIHEAISRGDQASFLSGLGATRETILAELTRWSSAMSVDDQAVVVLIGHGSTAGGDYRFNVPGPDITGAELASAISALPAGRQVIVNTSSASGALLKQIPDQQGRVLVTATKNGRELQATRFARHFAAALKQSAADLDKDRRISVGEAFGYAQRAVADYYKTEGLLATEHPRQTGNEPERLILADLDSRASAGVSPELLARQAQINEDIAALRARRSSLSQEAYFDELQALLVQLSLVSTEIEQAESKP